MPHARSTLAGFLNVYKPAGLTSHDVVARVRRWSSERHVGHGGTLDPQATGVLPLALGPYTRLLEYIPDPKVYEAQVLLGVATTTYDAEGEVTATGDPSGVDEARLRAALAAFVGEAVPQRPPPYSAVKREGRRAYELARAGDTTPLEERPVRVYRIDLLAFRRPHVWLRIVCGRGMYVRSLAHDLGQALGCGGHLVALERTHNGPFAVEHAHHLDALEAALRDDPASCLLSGGFPFPHWPSVRLGRDREARVLQGNPLILTPADLWPPKPLTVAGVQVPPVKDRCLAYGSDGRVLAMLQREPGGLAWRPVKVFPLPAAPARAVAARTDT